MRRILLSLAWALACTSVTAPAIAQAFPEKPVRLIVPFPPGGGSDGISRILADKMNDIWDQPLVVENVPGAQGSVGMAQGAMAEPDGHTILLAVQSAMALSPWMYSDIDYDVLEDFEPITRIVEQEYILAANPAVPVDTLQDIVDAEKANPGGLTFATSASGPQFVGELFNITSDIELLHVPYAGAGPAKVAAVSGETDLIITSPVGVVPMIQEGQLKGIAVIGDERNEQIPDVPSAAESGFPDISNVPEWYALVAPAGTPEPIIDKLNEGFVTALQDPEVQASIRALGSTPSPSTPEEMAKLIKYDYERWGEILKSLGIEPQ